jgi:hypothetical protein
VVGGGVSSMTVTLPRAPDDYGHVDRRDERLKLHARIIDEFNLPLLEKVPHEELVRQVRAANYIRTDKISWPTCRASRSNSAPTWGILCAPSAIICATAG